MGSLNDMRSIKKWLEDNVCPQVKLKVYREDADLSKQADYVHPLVYENMIPEADFLKENEYNAPAIAIEFLKTKDDINDSSRIIDIRLCVLTYSHGLQPGDVLKKDVQYQRNYDGFQSYMNFIDIIMKEIEKAEEIGGFALDRSVAIETGQMTDEYGTIIDYYPFFAGYVSFSIQRTLLTTTKVYDDLL